MAEEFELDEEGFLSVAAEVEAGTDAIEVPVELMTEYDGPAHAPAQSLYAQVLGMGVSEKIKLALRGNRDARMILIRDGARLIRRFVLQNPRISDGEVIAICRNRSADDELLRRIADSREWMRNYQVRLALASNSKTPLAVAMKQVSSLQQRDLEQLAKSKNVSQTVAAQARRLLQAKGQH
jgi:hypothetical protein